MPPPSFLNGRRCHGQFRRHAVTAALLKRWHHVRSTQLQPAILASEIIAPREHT